MEPFSILWQVFTFVIMTSFEIVTKVADEVMFTLEDNEVYAKIVKAIATIGFYCYLRRLADNFPAPHILVNHCPVDVGPSMEQLLEERNAAVRKSDNLDRENAGLHAKVERLQKEVDYITNDRYALVHEKLILQNKLGDFNSWPEFRIEYDELTTEFVAMKRQRAKEHTLQERTLRIAKETKVELAAAKRSEAMGKIAHRKELERVQQEREEAKAKYRLLLTTTCATAATTAPAVTAAAATAATLAAGNPSGDFNLHEESARLTLLLRSQSPLFSNLSSDLGRVHSHLKSRSKHSAFQLQMAALTITALEAKKAKAEERIAGLERDVQEAKAKVGEMEDLYMAVAFGDEGETSAGSGQDESGGEDEEEEGGEGGIGGEGGGGRRRRRRIGVRKEGETEGEEEESGGKIGRSTSEKRGDVGGLLSRSFCV